MPGSSKSCWREGEVLLFHLLISSSSSSCQRSIVLPECRCAPQHIRETTRCIADADSLLCSSKQGFHNMIISFVFSSSSSSSCCFQSIFSPARMEMDTDMTACACLFFVLLSLVDGIKRLKTCYATARYHLSVCIIEARNNKIKVWSGWYLPRSSFQCIEPLSFSLLEKKTTRALKLARWQLCIANNVRLSHHF